ncbi:hypothetical protein [Amycolatopsis sp. cmx-4-54]|uniref:hypothetical protein n=1 Tax=Amycolatopsis sp. cmx-4-54 TaxID=2790936 RepID=UPI00397B3B97
MNIKRVGVLGVAGLTTAAVGAWTFGAFDGTDEATASAAPAAAPAPAAATAPKPVAAPQQQAAPVNPLVQQVAPPAAVPAAPAAKPVPVKKVAKIKPAAVTVKKVERQKTRHPVVKAAVTKDGRVQLPPRVIVVEKPAPVVPESSKKIIESVAKANGSLDTAKKLIDKAGDEVKKAKGELDKAKSELKKLKADKHKHSKDKGKNTENRKQAKPAPVKGTGTGHVSVDSKGLKPGQTRTATTSSPDGSSWSSATVTVK